MTESGSVSGHVLLGGHQNSDSTPEDEPHSRSVTAPQTAAEPLEISISAATQVGHQLAVIGDDYNRTYSWKEGESWFNLAKGMAANALQTSIWSHFKSITKGFGSFFKNEWRKKIFEYGEWILLPPLQSVSQKWVSATLLAVLMWWLFSQGLQK